MNGAKGTTPFSLEPQTRRRLVDDPISDIAKELQSRRATFLFGAGMSIPAPSEMPSGWDLGRAFVRGLLRERKATETEIDRIASKFPLEALAEGFEKDNPRKESGLCEFISAVLRSPTSGPHKGHEALVGLSHYLPKIYTTNFDNLIETKFGKDGCVSIAVPEDMHQIQIAADRGVPAIVHLHGMVGDRPVRDHFLVTESDFFQRDSPLLTILEGELHSNAIVFVGYSLSDPHLRRLYFKVKRYLDQRPMMKKATFAVSPVKSEDELSVAEKAWAARGITLIPEDAAEFMVRLANEVGQAVNAAKRKEVADRILGKDGDVANLDEEVKRIVETVADVRKEDIFDCFEELTRSR